MVSCTIIQYLEVTVLGMFICGMLYIIILDYLNNQQHAEWRELLRLREAYTPQKTVIDAEQARLQQLEAQFRKE